MSSSNANLRKTQQVQRNQANQISVEEQQTQHFFSNDLIHYTVSDIIKQNIYFPTEHII